jgi:single-strand DNA-binding protein
LPIARFCIAVSHYIKDESGNYREEASFIDAVAFGKTAQTCQDSLKKGSPVLIEGNLKTRTYTDNNNTNRKVTEIIINRAYPLERDEGYVPNQNYQSQPQPSNQDYGYQNSQPRQNQNQNMNTNQGGDFPYNEASMDGLVTEDDVPF